MASAPQDSKAVFACSVGGVPAKAKEALRYKLKNKAMDKCRSLLDAFASCCSGRYLSLAWACQEENNELKQCLAKWRTESQLIHFQEQWVALKCPENGFDPTLKE